MNATAPPANNHRQRFRRRRVAVAVTVVLVVGFVVGAFWAIPAIQNDLESKAQARLAGDGVVGVSVKFAGQDGTLSCTTPLLNAAAVKSSLASIKGVHQIRLGPSCTGVTTVIVPSSTSLVGQSTTTGSAVPSPITPVVKVGADGKVTLSGQVASSQEGYRLVDTATKAFGVVNVSSTMSVGTGAGPRSDALVDQLVSLVSVFAGRLQAGEAGIANDKLYLKGVTADEAALAALTDAARIAGVATEDIALAVDQPSAANALKTAAVFSDGKFKLTGTVTTAHQMQVLIAAAEKATSPQAVTTELQVHGVLGDTTNDELTIGHLATLIQAMPANLLSGEVGFDGKALYANGVYFDEAAKSAFSAVATTQGVTAALEARPPATAADAADLQQQLNDFVSANPILFESNKAVLLSSATAILDRIAAIAKQFAGTSIEVQGHTDSTGDPATNLALSQHRADAVVEALVSRGVPTSQLVAKGYGETQPKVPNDSAANRAINRRVEFVVTVK
jgi:OOP family OmpA-OmpF porin